MAEPQVKEKPVAQIELFLDLIYVYAISRLTLLVEEPVGGVIPPAGLARYLVVCLVILQAWLYLTNYVNRYGQWRWWEYLLTCVNMIGAVYVANTISASWDEMTLAFNLAMLVMLACVWAMYLVQVLLAEQDTGAAKNSLQILSVDCVLYLAAAVASAAGAHEAVIWLDVAAVLVGAFLPFLLRGHFDPAIISFPHLAERFELLTIVTFGEGVVGMTGYFDVTRLSALPVLVFALLLGLFGCYMVQLHDLCDHHRVARALRLMFTHYGVVVSVNLLTVGLHFLENPEADATFTAGLMVVALALFFVSILADSAYYRDGVRLGGRDVAVSVGCMAAGTAVMLLGSGSVCSVLVGVLVATGGNLCMLWRKRRAAGLAQEG